MKKILLIEDDRNLSNGICLALQNAEYTIHQCFSLKEARQKALSDMDLVILDINLPDGNGIEYLKDLREKDRTPVILLTANDTELDIVTGLESGANDYITKPFSLAVLRARVNARLRDAAESGRKQSSGYHNGRYFFDFDAMLFRVDEKEISLSKTEQRLLRLLVENRGNVLKRELLLDRVWANEAEFVDENALSVVIKRLRDKLEEFPARPRHIKTIYGIGYTWEEA